MQLPAAARALAAQLAALATGWLAPQLAGRQLSGGTVLAVISFSAALYGHAWRLPPWWLPIQAAFVPALVGLSALDLPSSLFLGLLLVLLLAYPSNLVERVPLYLSNRASWDALLTLLPADRPFSLIDLGCGNGGGLAYLAERRPLGRFAGVETAPLPFLAAWLRVRRLGNCRVRLGSLWREDLGDYGVVYAFLSPSPMPRLWRKVEREMRPGSLFVSNGFAVPGQAPDAVIEVDGGRRSRLLVWWPAGPDQGSSR